MSIERLKEIAEVAALIEVMFIKHGDLCPVKEATHVTCLFETGELQTVTIQEFHSLGDFKFTLKGGYQQ